MPAVTRDTNYTTPKTWNTGDPLTAADMNTYVRDNVADLKKPAGGYYMLNEGSDYTTSSSSFVDVDSTDLNISADFSGQADIVVRFSATVTGGTRVYFDIALDGVRQGGDDGIVAFETSANGRGVNFFWRIPAPSAGTHAVKLQWKAAAASATMYAGAGTANYDVHGIFDVSEGT